MSWDDGRIQPDTSLSAAQLVEMTTEEILAHFAPYLPAFESTRVITRVERPQWTHLFGALLAKRPMCGEPVEFGPMDGTFSRRHATCPYCLEASREVA